MAHYSKTYTSPAQLTALLQSRGLHVENVTRTENYLRHIGYYRFSAYLYPLLTTPKENHVFKDIIDDELIALIDAHLGRKRFKGYKIDGIDIQLVGKPTRKKYLA